MTLINLQALEVAIGLPGPLSQGTVEVARWAGSGPAVEVIGDVVTFPSVVAVAMNAGAPSIPLELPPTTTEWCYRIVVTATAVGRSLTRYVAVPETGPVDFGDLVQVDPHTFAPLPVEVSAAWDEALGQAQGAATAAATKAAEAAASAAAAEASKSGQVMSGSINGAGHLILGKLGGGTDDAGRVVAGPAEIAAAQGYWPIYSATPPAQTTMYGVPVVWIDSTQVVVPTPVLPPTMSWDDALSRFTVPTGVIGIDYFWTSGGGGVGAQLTPGATLSTTGTYPRTVTITPVAKPGYVLAAGVRPFVHDFPDPAAVTVLTSDGFSGAVAAGLTGRTVDNGLGGTLTPKWGDGAAWDIDGTGHAKANGPADGIAKIPIDPANRNTRVELVVTTLAESFDLSIRDRSTPENYVELALSPTYVGVRVSNGAGGAANDTHLAAVASGATLVPGTGLWVVQIYLTTMTVTDPAGHTRIWDLSDASKFNPGTGNGPHNIWMRKTSTGTGTVIDSIKVSKVGF